MFVRVFMSECIMRAYLFVCMNAYKSSSCILIAFAWIHICLHSVTQFYYTKKYYVYLAIVKK